MKKGWLNNKAGQDSTTRKENGSTKAPSEKQSADPPAATVADLRQLGSAAARKGSFEDAAEYHTSALMRELNAATTDARKIAMLAEYAEALLDASCTDDARRMLAFGSDGKWKALASRCEEKAQETEYLLSNMPDSPEMPPIPFLLPLLRDGIEDTKYWNKLTKRSFLFFHNFAAMLKENFGIESTGLLNSERGSVAGGLWPGAVEVMVFPDKTWQGGRRIALSRDEPIARAVEQVASALGIELDTASSCALRSWLGATFADGLGSEDTLPFSCVRHGDWIRLDQDGSEQLLPLSRAPKDMSWPPLRCPADMVLGALHRHSLHKGFESVRSQRAVILEAANLLPSAQRKWSLSHLDETIPSGTADSSRFSVFRATTANRRFRYIDAKASSSAYDVSSEQSADRLLLSFRDFVQKKQACANGDGDGWAYYLWGVALRKNPEGEYEGFNFGQSVDSDLLDSQNWNMLESIRQAAGWGKFIQAQIFIGCQNALTPCHYDLTHNIYVQVSGWKRFVIFDPGYSGCLYPFPTGHPMDRCARVDLEQPDYERFPRLREAYAVEAVLGPGDTLVLPAGWWHHVQTLTEDSISVSFWYEDDRFGRAAVAGGGGGPLSAFDRLLLAREAEQFLERILGTESVCQAAAQLRGMLGGQASRPVPEQILPCCFLLWRLTRTLGAGGVRRFIRSFADDARFSKLVLKTGNKK